MSARFLIVEVPFGTHLAIPFETGAQIAPIMTALMDARAVNGNGYGSERKYIPSEAPMETIVVPAAQVCIDERDALRAKLEAKERDYSQVHGWWIQAQKQLEELKKQAAAAPAAESLAVS